jgi:hypothetical protein
MLSYVVWRELYGVVSQKSAFFNEWILFNFKILMKPFQGLHFEMCFYGSSCHECYVDYTVMTGLIINQPVSDSLKASGDTSSIILMWCWTISSVWLELDVPNVWALDLTSVYRVRRCTWYVRRFVFDFSSIYMWIYCFDVWGLTLHSFTTARAMLELLGLRDGETVLLL